MKEKIKSSLERRRYVANHINETSSSLAKKLGISKRMVAVYKKEIRAGITGHKDRTKKGLERRFFILKNLNKTSLWLADKLGISVRAVDMIKKEIEAGRVTLEDAKQHASGTNIVTPLFPDWLTEIVERKMRLKRPPMSLSALHKQVVAALPKHLKEHAHEVTKKNILNEFENLFWKGRDPIVRDALRAGFTPEKLHEILSKHSNDRAIPPKWVVKTKYEHMKGLSRAPREKEVASLRGILRVPLGDAPAHSLLSTSFKKPFHALSESTKDQFRIGLISAPQLGLPYDPDIELNLTRCGFAAARKDNCDALVISGGLFRITWQKTSGPNRLLNDLAMGTEIDIEEIAVSYRDRMNEIIESGSFEPIYITAREGFINRLRGWYKVTQRPDGTPEFNKPVYVVLSPADLGLARRMAYFELLALQNKELGEARAALSLYSKVLAKASEALMNIKHDGTEEEISLAEKAHTSAEQAAARAAEQVARVQMTHLDSKQNIRVYNQALSYLLHEIDKNIPGWQVIDQNSAYVIFGKSKHVVRFVSGGDTNNPYYDELGSYGPAQRREELPALTIVSHPRAIYPRKTTRENYIDGSMEGTASFAEAPMLVDKAAILERTDGNKVPLPVVKAVGDAMFNGGMTIIKIDPDFGVSPDFINCEAVRRIASPGGRPVLPPVKRLWLMIATDLHFGGSMRVFINRPSGLQIGLTEAVFELMQKWGLDANGVAPVAGMFVCDDITHGNHFGTHVRPHYGVRPYAQVVKEFENDLKNLPKDAEGREKKLKEMVKHGVNQIRYRPPDYLTGQFQELFHGLIRPFSDVFKGILLAAKQAGVVVKGVSDYAGTESDTRDLGIISWGSGNHATKTTDGMLHEGIIVAETLRMRLWSDPDLVGLNLDRLISSPLYQDTGIAYGTLKVGNGYEWGIHVSGTPPKRDSWKDTVHGWVQVNRSRGNPSSILNGKDGKAILHMTGDKHFFAGAFAGNDVYVMGPSSTHTDSYAEFAGGLAENNSGVAFVGLPVEGPDSGEITLVHLTRGQLQQYITSGEPFPWDKVLPNNILKR